MTNSMTGFGQAELSRNGMNVTIELSSVNYRYFDAIVRLPRRISHLEAAAKDIIRREISRGKIICSITWNVDEGVSLPVRFVEPVADVYVKVLRELKEKHGLAGEVSISDIAAMEGVFEPAEDETDPEFEKKLLEEAMMAALDKLKEMRASEGEKMVRDMMPRIDTILETVERIKPLSKESVDAYREKLEARIRDLIAEETDPADRIITEAAVVAERSDITEECVRTVSHCEQFREALDSNGPIGKRLNFILQELNREANTIGSKSMSSDISKEVINLKEQIEKIREQVQNIE